MNKKSRKNTRKERNNMKKVMNRMKDRMKNMKKMKEWKKNRIYKDSNMTNTDQGNMVQRWMMKTKEMDKFRMMNNRSKIRV